MTRSGPELRRRPSRGTNVNPFTPVELQRKSKSKSVQATPVVNGASVSLTPLFDKDLAKPHKVQLCSNIVYSFCLNGALCNFFSLSPETGSKGE